MLRIKKVDISKNIARQFKLSDTASNGIVEYVFDSIKEGVEIGHEVKIAGFGSFQQRKRKARKARNPKTGEPVSVPAGLKVKFTVSKTFKDSLARASKR